MDDTTCYNRFVRWRQTGIWDRIMGALAAGHEDRCDGLLDEARPGRPRTINDDQVAAVIERTLRTTPVDATHWSIRSMAAETGFSHTTIRRMWVAFGLQPHRSQTFKLSSDPLFVDKVRDRRPLHVPAEPSPCPQHR